MILARSREQFCAALGEESSVIQVEGLLDDAEVWALAAQGPGQTPLDVLVSDPAREFSALYRLADVRLVRPVGVTILARPGLIKAVRLAASLQLPVRLLPGQPGPAVLQELNAALEFYLHDSRVEAPIEFFHSLLAALRGLREGSLWTFLEEPPQEISHPECARCRWQSLCAGYFKQPDPAYDCAGVKHLMAQIEAAAQEITADLAALQP